MTKDTYTAYSCNIQEEDAARAYDRVAIAMGRHHSELNFHHNQYSHELDMLKSLGKQEVIVMCRQCSSRLSARVREHKMGKSGYRGVNATPSGKWEAKIW